MIVKVYNFSYLGYVPQFKFRIGGTYGKTTHKILYSPDKVTNKVGITVNVLYLLMGVDLIHRFIKAKHIFC